MRFARHFAPSLLCLLIVRGTDVATPPKVADDERLNVIDLFVDLQVLLSVDCIRTASSVLLLRCVLLLLWCRGSVWWLLWFRFLFCLRYSRASK